MSAESSARQGRSRARRVPSRRLGPDARASRERGGRFRDRRHRRRRRRRLACKLAEAGFSVVALRRRAVLAPARGFRFRRVEQQKLYWTDERISGGDNPIELGSNNSGRGSAARTVHFTMISLRFRPEWFKCADAARLRRRLAGRLRGDVALLRRGREALKIAGPVHYPWGRRAGAIPIARTR